MEKGTFKIQVCTRAFVWKKYIRCMANKLTFLIFEMLGGVYKLDCQCIRGAALAAGVCLS